MPVKKKPKTAKQREKKRANNGQFLPGHGIGRPKGSKNKAPAKLIDMIIEIAAELEKKKIGLKQCAEQNPAWFFERIFARILPKPIDVSGELDANLKITVIDRFEEDDGDRSSA